MLAHALALQLLLAPSPAAPTVRVLPPLELARPLTALAQAEPPAPSGEPAAPPASGRPGLGKTYGAALAGTLVSDLVFGGVFALGIAGAFSDGFFEGRTANAAWAVVALTAAAGFVFVTPAVTVWAAQRSAGRSRAGLAYAAVFAVRAAGFLLAAAFPPIALVTELVAAPLVGAAIVASGRPTEGAVPPPAVPEDPGSETGGAGSPLSRWRCPDTALARR